MPHILNTSPLIWYSQSDVFLSIIVLNVNWNNIVIEKNGIRHRKYFCESKQSESNYSYPLELYILFNHVTSVLS